MNEIQILERAKSYLDLLSKGIDPISGNEVSVDSTLNQERLKKCFSYVCGVLQKVIENGGEVVNISAKKPFSIPEEKKRFIALSQEPLSSTEFVKRINVFVDNDTTKRLSSAPIYKWLVENEYLTAQKMPVQTMKVVRQLSDKSSEVGITIKQHIVKTTGEVKELIAFTKEGQRFILEHLDEIVAQKIDDVDELQLVDEEIE